MYECHTSCVPLPNVQKYQLVKNYLLPVSEVTESSGVSVWLQFPIHDQSSFVPNLCMFLNIWSVCMWRFQVSHWNDSPYTAVRFLSPDAAVDISHESAHPLLNIHLRLPFRLDVEIRSILCCFIMIDALRHIRSRHCRTIVCETDMKLLHFSRLNSRSNYMQPAIISRWNLHTNRKPVVFSTTRVVSG
jgi:hypothetical protein